MQYTVYRNPGNSQGIPLPAGYTERHHWRVKYPPGDPPFIGLKKEPRPRLRD